MRKKILAAFFALIGLGTFVVMGSSPGFVGKIVETLQIPQVFPTVNSEDIIRKTSRRDPASSQVEKRGKVETSDSMLWHITFDFASKMQAKSEELYQQGQDGSLYSDYFIRQGPLSSGDDVHLKKIAGQYLTEIEPFDRRAKKIREAVKAGKVSGLDRSSSSELKGLQMQKDVTSLQYRDELRQVLGDETFSSFQMYLKTEFSEGSFAIEVADPTGGGINTIYYTPISRILWNDTYQQPLISGYSQLYFEYDFTGYSYDPYVESLLYNATAQSPLELGSNLGYQDIFPAEVYHSVFYSSRGDQYCVVTDHYGYLYDGQVLVDIEVLPSTADCHTVATAPPTPTPTPTPSPTPPCDPLTGDGLAPCEPTPTPTATPSATPSVSIVPIDLVEKYGERNFSLTIRNNDSGTTKLVLTTVAGTGTATFENATNVAVILGNTENQPLTIKGVLQSSQIDNIRIEARVNTDSTVKASDDFTVAVVTSLVFEKFSESYPDLDNNPGTDGTVNADGSEGQRIFPDAPGPNSKASSSVKVKATVLPAAANLKVYFGSFDLDDPSAAGRLSMQRESTVTIITGR